MDRLADRDLGAAAFGLDAREALPPRAGVIVVGGGIVGSSIAYHLAEEGVSDVIVLERNVLGSGTTWHAAGLVAGARSSVVLTGLAHYGRELYAGLQDRTGIDVSMRRPGSLSIARTEGRSTSSGTPTTWRASAASTPGWSTSTRSRGCGRSPAPRACSPACSSPTTATSTPASRASPSPGSPTTAG